MISTESLWFVAVRLYQRHITRTSVWPKTLSELMDFVHAVDEERLSPTPRLYGHNRSRLSLLSSWIYSLKNSLQGIKHCVVPAAMQAVVSLCQAAQPLNISNLN